MKVCGIGALSGFGYIIKDQFIVGFDVFIGFVEYHKSCPLNQFLFLQIRYQKVLLSIAQNPTQQKPPHIEVQ